MTEPLEYHPLANLFPLIEGKDFEEFCAGIKADGILHDKIVLLDGKILDGRNRYRACTAAGITAHFETYNAGLHGDPLTFVVSKNMHRRHLNPSQRAQIAAEAETFRHGGNRKADQDANLHLDRAARAEQFGVSERSVATAAEVRDRGAPELVEAVKSGDVAVSAAVEIVRAMPVEDQRKLLAEVAEAPDTKKAFSGVVKEIRRNNQGAKKDRRERKEADLGARQAALPDKRYGVVLADPEWRFEPWSRETGLDRAADNHYPTSTLEVIRARPVEAITAKDAVLFLWATAPMMPHALLVMAAWGFNYVSQVIWAKDRIGTGYWFRNKHELLLVGTRGNIPAPAMGTQWPSIVEAPVGRHSEKPDRFYELIEAYYPTLPRIELNARQARRGWTPWGLEAPDEPFDPETGELLGPSLSQGEGASLPPDIGIGVSDEPFHPHAVDAADPELVAPAGEKTRSAQGMAMEPSAETGQPPVAGGSSLSQGEVEYEGRVLKALYDKDAGTIDLITNGKPIHPELLDDARKEIGPIYPWIEQWTVTVDGKPYDPSPAIGGGANGGGSHEVAITAEKRVGEAGAPARARRRSGATRDCHRRPDPRHPDRGGAALRAAGASARGAVEASRLRSSLLRPQGDHSRRAEGKACIRSPDHGSVLR